MDDTVWSQIVSLFGQFFHYSVFFLVFTEDYAAAQRKYIMSLEIRFSDLCSECKSKTPQTAFTAPERESIMNIVRMLESQQQMITSLVSNAERPISVSTTATPDPETVVPEQAL